jgi:hypothetical protein
MDDPDPQPPLGEVLTAEARKRVDRANALAAFSRFAYHLTRAKLARMAAIIQADRQFATRTRSSRRARLPCDARTGRLFSAAA